MKSNDGKIINRINKNVIMPSRKKITRRGT